jgi:hypothetical protein
MTFNSTLLIHEVIAMRLLRQVCDKHCGMKLLQLSHLSSSPLLIVILFCSIFWYFALIQAVVSGHCSTEFDIRPLFGNAIIFLCQ